MHAMELFSSFEGLWQAGWTGEELGESCRYAGKIWPTPPGSLANLLQSRPAGTMHVWRYKASNGPASPVYQPWGPWLLRGGG